MVLNQQITPATITPEMVAAMLRDPQSWLFKQQAAALDERLSLHKAWVKLQYRLIHQQELDDRVAEAEAEALLRKQQKNKKDWMECFEKYQEEQNKLIRALGMQAGILFSSFSFMLMQHADLTQHLHLLLERELILADKLRATDDALADVEKKLDDSKVELAKTQEQVARAREQVDSKINNDTIIIGERTVPLSASKLLSLPEDQKKEIEKCQQIKIQEVVEGMSDPDHSMDEFTLHVGLMQVFKPVLQAGGVEKNATLYASQYFSNPFILAMFKELVELRRREREHEKIILQLGIEKTDLRKVAEKIREERVKLAEDITATKSQQSQLENQILHEYDKQQRNNPVGYSVSRLISNFSSIISSSRPRHRPAVDHNTNPLTKVEKQQLSVIAGRSR